MDRPKLMWLYKAGDKVSWIDNGNLLSLNK